MRLLLTVTYDIVTEASALDGDVSEQEFERQDEPTEVRDGSGNWPGARSCPTRPCGRPRT